MKKLTLEEAKRIVTTGVEVDCDGNFETVLTTKEIIEKASLREIQIDTFFKVVREKIEIFENLDLDTPACNYVDGVIGGLKESMSIFTTGNLTVRGK